MQKFFLFQQINVPFHADKFPICADKFPISADKFPIYAEIFPIYSENTTIYPQIMALLNNINIIKYINREINYDKYAPLNYDN